MFKNKQKQNFCIFFAKNLFMSKKSSTFALEFRKQIPY